MTLCTQAKPNLLAITQRSFPCCPGTHRRLTVLGDRCGWGEGRHRIKASWRVFIFLEGNFVQIWVGGWCRGCVGLREVCLKKNIFHSILLFQPWQGIDMVWCLSVEKGIHSPGIWAADLEWSAEENSLGCFERWGWRCSSADKEEMKRWETLNMSIQGGNFSAWKLHGEDYKITPKWSWRFIHLSI